MVDLEELERLASEATPGPWSVWTEHTRTRESAKQELAEQVDATEPFVGAVYMLEAAGKCPALTGCGPTSAANAAFIAAANPAAILSLIAALKAERERAEKAESERDTWFTRCAGAVSLLPDSTRCGELRDAAGVLKQVVPTAVAWRYRHSLNADLWILVNAPDWPERDPSMEPLYPPSALAFSYAAGEKAAESRLAEREKEVERLSAGLRTLCDNLDWEAERQTKLLEILEELRERVRAIEPDHRPEGIFKLAQDAVYAMRGRTDHHTAFRALLSPTPDPAPGDNGAEWCHVTGNPVGTDTWKADAYCNCPACANYHGPIGAKLFRHMVSEPTPSPASQGPAQEAGPAAEFTAMSEGRIYPGGRTLEEWRAYITPVQMEVDDD